jgi:hypothetical protein
MEIGVMVMRLRRPPWIRIGMIDEHGELGLGGGD